MKIMTLLLLLMIFATVPSVCQSMIQVLDFRSTALQRTITGSSNFTYQTPVLDLLAKFGQKSQGQQ
jgi:hypothetical protein